MNTAEFARMVLPLAQETTPVPAQEAPAPAPAPVESTPAIPAAPTDATQTNTVAPGATTQGTPATPPPAWLDWVPLILAMVVLYFFVFRSKSTKEKQRVKMLGSLKKGDRIQTIGGIIGTVVDPRDNEVVVKVDETSNTKMTFSRNAIHRVLEEEKK